VTQTEQAAPVVAGIPFLRRGRDELAAEVRERLAAGDERGALVELLADHDDWWPFGVPDRADRERAIDAPTLREAMDHLGYGPVGDYFAFRWSDPTFLSGLGLLEHHARGAASLFELGCGIGHLLREGARRGMAVAGGDVVFSKLWLCRRFVCPQARLWCFDAADAVPLADGEVEVALCHDALHYLPDPAHAVGELRRVASTAVLVGHAHNADVDNLSGGAHGGDDVVAGDPAAAGDGPAHYQASGRSRSSRRRARSSGPASWPPRRCSLSGPYSCA
jgi:SAM-dependent methyltransferase